MKWEMIKFVKTNPASFKAKVKPTVDQAKNEL